MRRLSCEGTQVRFQLGFDEKTGRQRARNVEIVGGPILSESSGDRIHGTIKRFKDPWGWIDSPEGDIFAHRQDVLQGSLSEGASVTFEIGLDPKTGKSRVMKIMVDSGLVGRITSWKEAWGWITCPQVLDGDVFAHKEDLVDVFDPRVGLEVTFTTGTDKQGRKRARRICHAWSGKGGGKESGMFSKSCGKMAMIQRIQQAMQSQGMHGGCGKGGKGFKAAPAMGMPPPAPGKVSMLGQQLEGQITMWKEHWGWITSNQLNGDIFAHIEDFTGTGGPSMGMNVVFTVGQDVKSKRARALNYHEKTNVTSMALGADSGRKRKLPTGDGGEGRGFEHIEGQTVEAVVQMWRQAWGWVRCTGYFEDIFAHKEDVVTGEDLVPGMVISCVVGRDDKSQRWRAKLIQPTGTYAQSIQQTAYESQSGQELGYGEAALKRGKW